MMLVTISSASFNRSTTGTKTALVDDVGIPRIGGERKALVAEADLLSDTAVPNKSA